MTYTLGSCQEEELPALVRLANRVFRGSRPGDMGSEYPLVFAPANREQLRVARLGADMVSHVGISIRDASLLGARLRVSLIGAVCTDPDHRGHGLASLLMEDAAAHSVAQGASLMLISGGRGLYHRLGYVEVGRFLVTRIAGGEAPRSFRVDAYQPEDLGAVIGLQQREPVRFLRPRTDWEAVLAAGRLMNQPAELLVIRQDGAIVAYAGVQRPADPSAPIVRARVREVAGSRAALADVLPAIRARYQAAEVDLVTDGEDTEWRVACARHGWSVGEAAFPGTLGVIDPARFLAAVQPVLTERSGDRVVLEPAGEGAVLRAAGEAVPLQTKGELTALLFGGSTEEARALPPLSPAVRDALTGVLPLPLFWYGFNYV